MYTDLRRPDVSDSARCACVRAVSVQVYRAAVLGSGRSLRSAYEHHTQRNRAEDADKYTLCDDNAA